MNLPDAGPKRAGPFPARPIRSGRPWSAAHPGPNSGSPHPVTPDLPTMARTSTRWLIKSTDTTFELAPGVCHGACSFAPLVRELRRHGHEAYPVTPTGVGEPYCCCGCRCSAWRSRSGSWRAPVARLAGLTALRAQHPGGDALSGPHRARRTRFDWPGARPDVVVISGCPSWTASRPPGGSPALGITVRGDSHYLDGDNVHAALRTGPRGRPAAPTPCEVPADRWHHRTRLVTPSRRADR